MNQLLKQVNGFLIHLLPSANDIQYPYYFTLAYGKLIPRS